MTNFIQVNLSKMVKIENVKNQYCHFHYLNSLLKDRLHASYNLQISNTISDFRHRWQSQNKRLNLYHISMQLEITIFYSLNWLLR